MLGGLSVTELLIIIGVILVSLTIHEMMHAFTGHKLGDDTAAQEGRITLNPLAHIDPIMTVALPVLTTIAFGAPILAAKPVPFDPYKVKWGEYGSALIAAAGPFSNLALAILGVGLANVIEGGALVSTILYFFVTINVSLFVFNLLPIPPLDGSRVLYAFAPDGVRRLFDQLEPYGLFIVFGIVLLGGGGFITEITRWVLQVIS